MSLSNSDRGRDLNEAVERSSGRLRHAGRGARCECLRTTRSNRSATGRDLAGAGDYAQGNRRAECFEVVIIHLVLQALFSDLVETMKLVEIDRVAIRHD